MSSGISSKSWKGSSGTDFSLLVTPLQVVAALPLSQVNETGLFPEPCDSVGQTGLV